MTPLFDYINNFSKYEDVKSILQYGDISSCVSPCISIIMPIFQSPQYFKDALLSVVNQDCDILYEIIVVDNTPFDGEKSETLLFIEELSLSNLYYYRNEKNIGMFGNFNRGIELARAELITFCHDDDMLLPNCLSTLLEIHKRYPNKPIFSAHIDIDEDTHFPLKRYDCDSIYFKKKYEYGKWDIILENPSNGVGSLFLKSQVMCLGGYNEEYYPATDYALNIKNIFECGSVFYRLPLFCYRIANNTSYKIYPQYFVIMPKLWKCVLFKLHIPSCLSKKIVMTLLKGLRIAHETRWNQQEQCQLKMSFVERVLLWFFCLPRKLKMLI
jgi:glycosyltransferase involved in cell wall biosynthesis